MNEAIACYNSMTTVGVTTISLTADIVLTGTTTPINNTTPDVSLLIAGNSQTLDGDSTYTGLVIMPNTVVTISELTIQRGTPTNSATACLNAATACGGGVLNYGRLTVSNSTFTGNLLGGETEAGGGIANIGGLLIVSNSTFRANLSLGRGSAIGNLGVMFIDGSTFDGNQAAGGAIVNAHQATISNTDFTNNIGGLGGAILNIAELTIQASTFTDNSAMQGGAVLNTSNTTPNATPGSLTVSDSTFTRNQAATGTFCGCGGAIFGTLDTVMIISTSVFTGNVTEVYGGAIRASGNMTVSHSTFINNRTPDTSSPTIGGGGLAIDSTSTSLVTNNLFIGNSSGRGGGVNASGNLTLEGNTFINNTSAAFGGGLRLNPGQLVSNTTVVATNNTFRGNSADFGGAISTNKDVTLNNNTLTDNSATTSGGGIHVITGTLTVNNTIIANSTSGGDCQVDASSGRVNASHTLIEATGADACNLVDGADDNQIGVDPDLAALADNGGATETHALNGGSPAINAGDNGSCADTDQRGVTRPLGSSCDIGSFESICAETMNVASTAELNAAFQCFNAGSANRATTTINFAADITLDAPTTPIQSPAGDMLVIEGANHVLDAANTYTGLIINQSTIVQVNNLTVQHGVPTTVSPLQCGSAATACGGGILSYGQLTVNGSTFLSNTLSANEQAGGGIANIGGALFVNDSTFRGNTGGQGSAIGNLGLMAVNGSTFEGNTAAVGAVVNAGQGTIDDSTFTGNIGGFGAGATNIGVLTVRTSSFTGNQANAASALFNSRRDPLPPGQMTVIDSTFTSNQATNAGALATVSETVTTVMSSTFTSNVAAEQGGAIVIQGDATLSDNTFVNNEATDSGGAVRLDSTSTTTLERNTFDSNQSDRGGAVGVLGNLTLNSNTFVNNTATEFGGGLRVLIGEIVTDTTVIATNNTFSGNSAGVSGGGISTNKDLTLNNITLSGNAAASGGGVHVITGTLTINNSIIANSATGGDCQVDLSSGSVNISHTLIEATGADACGITDGTDGNIVGEDPQLGILQDNTTTVRGADGPTHTHALFLSSPAIDAGDSETCAQFDQRGFGRTDDICDMGSYEASGAPLAVTLRHTTASQALPITLLTSTLGLLMLTLWMTTIRPRLRD